jgi:hypothetical protein
LNEQELLSLLVDELTLDLNRLQQIKPFIIEVQSRYASHEPDELELYIPGGVLHDLYNGIEAVFSRVARQLDGHVPSGANWHRELLDQMSKPFLPSRRHSVIHHDTVLQLEEYRKFRHVVRIHYGFSLDWNRLKPLVDNAMAVLDIVTADIEQFVEFLRMIASD